MLVFKPAVELHILKRPIVHQLYCFPIYALSFFSYLYETLRHVRILDKRKRRLPRWYNKALCCLWTLKPARCWLFSSKRL